MKRNNSVTQHAIHLTKLLLVTVSLAVLLVACTSEQNEILKIGDPGPDFSLKDLDGKTFSLSEKAGLPVILRFFLNDCKFCRADTPIFNEYFSQYGDTHLGMIYIESLGIDRKTLEAFRQEHSIPFPVATDAGGTVAAKYTVKALPQTIILDPQHTIIAAVLGGISKEELQEILAPYLP